MRLGQPPLRAIQRHRLGRGRWSGDASGDGSSEGRSTAIVPVGEDHRIEAAHAHEVVDLLNPEPAVIVDVERLLWALGFAFAGGDTGGSLRRALHAAPLAETGWDPESFEPDLFISELLRTCLRVRMDGLSPTSDEVFLTRLLTSPPKDPEVVTFRREVLSELAGSEELRDRFRKTYGALYQMRELFESEGHLYELDDTQRRLETLGAIRAAVESMASGFSSCESGLRRIHDFATYGKVTEGYSRLVELLDYDNHLASVDLKVRVGADGRIRRFEILRSTENKENRFHQSPLGRLFTRIGLIFRGYVLGEGELVNRWVDSVYEGVAELLPPMIQLLGEMELYLSALAFKDMAESKGLAVCLPDLRDPEDEDDPAADWAIEGLFNPLLFEQDITPVPCDLCWEGWETITVVTGPNSGGKTRLLQGVAIAQMLAQCGLYAPARKATLGRATGLFASLIQGARSDTREGRLGTELIRIREVFERSRPGSLIILDELCSGTNPSEGEEIFRLVISLLGELRPRVFITTHFLQFAARLRDEEDRAAALRFLQVDLDDEDLPTFKFIDGVAETSLAHQTAARLGVTRGELLALVRRHRGER